MDTAKFLKAVRDNAIDGAVQIILKGLERPPGRRPQPQLVAMSDWYNNLSERDAGMVKLIIEDAAIASAFELLSIIDGAVSIDDEVGTFELRHTGSQETLLNPEGTVLHELLDRSWSKDR